MAHINYLWIEGQARLAKKNLGYLPHSVSRMVRGKSTPSLAAVLVITRVLEQRFGKRIRSRDMLNFDGQYPTPSVCDLCGCKGCLPEGFTAATMCSRRCIVASSLVTGHKSR